MKTAGILQALSSVGEAVVDSAPSLTAAAPERHMVEVFVSAIATRAVILCLRVLLVAVVSATQDIILAMVSEIIEI